MKKILFLLVFLPSFALAQSTGLIFSETKNTGNWLNGEIVGQEVVLPNGEKYAIPAEILSPELLNYTQKPTQIILENGKITQIKVLPAEKTAEKGNAGVWVAGLILAGFLGTLWGYWKKVRK